MDNKGNIHHLWISPVEVDTDKVKYVFEKVINKPDLNEVKKIVTCVIDEYDHSDDVDVFICNGEKRWLDKETRVSLKNKFEVLKKGGYKSGSLWFGNTCYNVNCTKILTFLNNLEIYAIQCKDTTMRHLSEINTLESIDDVIRYDITKDYPEPLTISKDTFV
jgi:hypothetical protein